MIITLVCAVMFLVTVVGYCSEDDKESAAPVVFMGIMPLVFCLFIIILSHATFTRDMVDYRALQDGLNSARLNGNPIELAAIQKDVIQYNRDLATRKWNKKHPWTNWFIPKKWLDVEPIK